MRSLKIIKYAIYLVLDCWINDELLVYQHCIPSHKTNVQYT